MPSWHKCIYVTTAGKFMVRNFPDTRFGHSCCYDSFKPRLIIILIILDFILSISFFMLYISYNLSNWSHDWQQISLELGKFLQKNTKLHFFHSLHYNKGERIYPYPFSSVSKLWNFESNFQTLLSRSCFSNSDMIIN